MDTKPTERALDEALEMTFPASDPIALSPEPDANDEDEEAYRSAAVTQ
jgi:hypothetical protein